MNGWLLILLICLGLLILWIWYKFKFKRIVTNCVCLITGAPKTGKDELQNDLASRKYKAVHRAWWIRKHIFRKKEEEPLYYTNYKTGFKGWWRKGKHPLDKNIRSVTVDLLERNTRPAYRSVISITEASLVNDNFLSIPVPEDANMTKAEAARKGQIETQRVNIELSLFYKLIGHETRGGYLYCNTQALPDLHYAPKRVCSNFLFIQKRVRVWWTFGLFDCLYVREMINNDLGAVNTFDSDLDDSMKLYVCFRPHVFRLYDCYELEKFTRDLPVEGSILKDDDGLVSFNPKYVSMADKRHVSKKEGGK